MSSLPVPVSPWISTVESVGATISTCCSACLSSGLSPTISLEVVVRANFLFEIELLFAQLFLELGDFPIGQAVLDRDGHLLRHLVEELDLVAA